MNHQYSEIEEIYFGVRFTYPKLGIAASILEEHEGQELVLLKKHGEINRNDPKMCRFPREKRVQLKNRTRRIKMERQQAKLT